VGEKKEDEEEIINGPFSTLPKNISRGKGRGPLIFTSLPREKKIPAGGEKKKGPCKVLQKLAELVESYLYSPETLVGGDFWQRKKKKKDDIYRGWITPRQVRFREAKKEKRARSDLRIENWDREEKKRTWVGLLLMGGPSHRIKEGA